MPQLPVSIAEFSGADLQFCGHPLHEYSKEQLTQIVAWLYDKNQRVEKQAMAQSIDHIHELAEMAKARA